MSDVPTLVKLLRFLRSRGKPCSNNDITVALQEDQGRITRALNKLLAEGIVHCHNGAYSYAATAQADTFSQKLLALYDVVIERRRIESLVRGLLSKLEGYMVRKSALLEILEGEGFAGEEITRFLSEEIRRGYVKTVPVIFVPTTALSPPLLISSNRSLARAVGEAEYERLREQYHQSELRFQEEAYLAASYPNEIADLARQTEKTEIGELLRKKFL